MASSEAEKELRGISGIDTQTDEDREEDGYEEITFSINGAAATNKVIAEADAFWNVLRDPASSKEAWWANPIELGILVASGFGSYAYYAGCLALGFFPEAFKIFAGINSLTWSAVGPAGMGRDIVNDLQPKSEEETIFLETVKKSFGEKLYQKIPYFLGGMAAIPITALTLFEVDGEPAWEQIFWLIACYVPTSAMMTYSLLKLMHPVPNELLQTGEDALTEEEMKLFERIRKVMLARTNANEGLLSTLELENVRDCIALLKELLSKPTLPTSKKLLFTLALGALVAVIGLTGYTADTAVFFNMMFHIIIRIIDSALKGLLTAVAIIPFANLMFGSVQKVVSSVYKFADAWSQGNIQEFIKEQILLYSILPKMTLAIIGSIGILGLFTGFTNGNNSREMTRPFIDAIVTFIKEIVSLFKQDTSYDSSDGYMDTDYLSEGASYWDNVEGIVSWIVAGCAAATSISFNIFYSIVAVLDFTLARAKWFSSDKMDQDKAELIVAARKFIAALPNLPVGKFMLLLRGFPDEVISSILTDKEVNIKNVSDNEILRQYNTAIGKVEKQRERISSNSNLFLAARINARSGDEEDPLLKRLPNSCPNDMLLCPDDSGQEPVEKTFWQKCFGR